MQALDLSDSEVNELEAALLYQEHEWFEELVQEKYALDFSYSVAELLWDMYHKQ